MLDASLDIAETAVNVVRFEINRSALRDIVEAGFSNKLGSFSSTDISAAATRVVKAMVLHDETTDDVRVAVQAVRPFTRSDDGSDD